MLLIGVDKPVDVLAAAIYAKLTVYDLPRQGLAYASPFSPAKESIVVAGYVAGNSVSGEYTEISANHANSIFLQADINSWLTLLCVGNPSEMYKEGYIVHAVNVPLLMNWEHYLVK